MRPSGGGAGKLARRQEESGEKGKLAAVAAAGAGGGCGSRCAESVPRAWASGRAGLGATGRAPSGTEMAVSGFRGRAKLGAGGRTWETSMLVGKVAVRMILPCCTATPVTMGLPDTGLARRKFPVGRDVEAQH